MKRLLLILAVAGFFTACSEANSQDCSKDDKAKTEMTEKKAGCCDSKKETKSDCDTKKTSETKEAKTGCGAKEKAECGAKGNTPC